VSQVSVIDISGAGRGRQRCLDADIWLILHANDEAGGTGIMKVTGKTTLIRLLGITLTVAVLHLPGIAQASGTSVAPELDPPQGSRQDMIGDLVLQRPFGIANTLVGIGVWVVALPFTVFSGSTGDAGVKLIAEPGAHTFTRPLGYPAPVSPDN